MQLRRSHKCGALYFFVTGDQPRTWLFRAAKGKWLADSLGDMKICSKTAL